MVEFTQEQKDKIRKYVGPFKEYLASEEGKKFEEKNRSTRIAYFQTFLGQHNIDNLDEGNLRGLISNLWATEFWINKKYREDKVINDNSPEMLKKNLKYLLYEEERIEEKWDNFRRSTKGFGPSSISEILSFVHPDKYGLWNQKPINVLPFLGLMTEDEVRKITQGYTNGADYIKANQVLLTLRDELKSYGIKDVDLIKVDFFLYFIFITAPEFKEYKKKKRREKKKGEEVKKEEVKVKETIQEVQKLGHIEIQGILAELGNLLGYDTYVADPSEKFRGKRLSEIATLKEMPQFTLQRLIETAKNIDVIWFKEEFPVCCFEIEHTTGVTSGLFRLYQLRRFNAKFFILAPKGVISKFKKEINKDPFYHIKERYTFRSYEELLTFYGVVHKYDGLSKEFLGLAQ